MSSPIMYTSDCRACSYLLVSPTRTLICPKCNSMVNCTPPTPIFVYPRRPSYYNSDLEEAINTSFEEERDPEPRPASEQTLYAMQKVVLTGEHGLNRECGICLEQLNPGDMAVITPCCRHYAHQECMEKALVVVPYCPFCKWCAQD